MGSGDITIDVTVYTSFLQTLHYLVCVHGTGVICHRV